MPATHSTDWTLLPEREQVQVLQQVAQAALPAFGVESHRISLVMHGYNTTFKVERPDGACFAARVHTNSLSTPAQITAQQTWVQDLRTSGSVNVPLPANTVDGGWLAQVRLKHTEAQDTGFDATLVSGEQASPSAGVFNVVLNEWRTGESRRLEPDLARRMGACMAKMHQHASQWQDPAAQHFPEYLAHQGWSGDALADIPMGKTDAFARALDASLTAVRASFDREQVMPCHGDLHMANMLWEGNEPWVIDFDDACLATRSIDIAVSAFYLRRVAGAEAAFREGYAEVCPLPDVSPEELEALVVWRSLVLVNSYLDTTNTELRSETDEYLALTQRRLDYWDQTGRFEIDPPQD